MLASERELRLRPYILVATQHVGNLGDGASLRELHAGNAGDARKRAGVAPSAREEDFWTGLTIIHKIGGG